MTLSARTQSVFDAIRRREQAMMIALALVVGLLGGLSGVGFRQLIRGAQVIAWGVPVLSTDWLAGLPWWWIVLAPAAGGLLAGVLVVRFAAEAKGHGVPEVMEAVALRGARIRPRVVVAKMVASACSIGSGGSAGREGPIVQVGAALGSAVGQWLGLTERQLRTLVACGAAAGIAGTFNAPVAGALFAVEIILGDFAVSQFSPIVVASVAATVVGHHFLGDVPAFEIPAHSLSHPSEFAAYAVLGLLAAVVAVGFIRLLDVVERSFERSPVPPMLRPAVGGLAVGLLALAAPQVLGVGYETITDTLYGRLLWPLMLALVFLKIVAVSFTLGSGGSGGIFSPSLFIGAVLGGAVGSAVQAVWPATTGGPGAYALVGMGALVAGTTHAPITAILIIFELTGDYGIILPLMISCILASLFGASLQRASIYTVKLARRGIDLQGGRDANVLRDVPVRALMRSEVARIASDTPLSDVLSRFVEHDGASLFVTDVDDGDRLRGIVTAREIRPAMRDAATLGDLVIAEDVMAGGELPTVGPDDSVADVMQFLEQYRGEVPVLDGSRLVGAIWPEDVIKRYHREVLRRDMAQTVASAVRAEQGLRKVSTGGDAVIAEVPAPSAFVGRTIGTLDVRRRHGLSILMVRQRGPDGREIVRTTPDADYEIRADDVLLVMGSAEAVRAIGG